MILLEQNYRNDPLSQGRLLNLFEGKTIDYIVRNPDGPTRIVQGRVVRSGYVPHYDAMAQYGQQYAATQMASARGGAGEPIVEVDGKLQFSLPGQPVFPALGTDTVLQPSVDWTLYSAQPARFDAELSYVSGGMSWAADYNIVAPENGDTLDLAGWVTLDNQSGRAPLAAALPDGWRRRSQTRASPTRADSIACRTAGLGADRYTG